MRPEDKRYKIEIDRFFYSGKLCSPTGIVADILVRHLTLFLYSVLRLSSCHLPKSFGVLSFLSRKQQHLCAEISRQRRESSYILGDSDLIASLWKLLTRVRNNSFCSVFSSINRGRPIYMCIGRIKLLSESSLLARGY